MLKHSVFKFSSKGFTLLELLVVVAIISILVSVVITSISSARIRAQEVPRVAALRAIAYALELYELDHEEYPHAPDIASESDIIVSGTLDWTEGLSGVLDPYFDTEFPNAVYVPESGRWAHLNLYRYTGSNGSRFIAISLPGACIQIFNGYYLWTLPLIYPNYFSMNDNGVSPYLFEIIGGDYRIVNPSDCGNFDR